MKRLQEKVPSPKEIVPHIDAAWEQTILRCLERDPRERFQSAGDVMASLSTA